MRKLVLLVIMTVSGFVFGAGTQLLFVNSDFENGSLLNWEPEGTAFEFQPVKGDNPAVRKIGSSQHQGQYWIGTYDRYNDEHGTPGSVQGDSCIGVLTSTKFLVKKPYINFLSGGGSSSDTSVFIKVAGVNYFLSSGMNAVAMRQVSADVSEFIGMHARIVIIDNSSGGWGHVNADNFTSSDKPIVEAVKPSVLPEDMNEDFKVDKKYLVVPIDNDEKISDIRVKLGDQQVRFTSASLAMNKAKTDRWAFFDVSEYKGKKLNVSVSNCEDEAFGRIKLSDTVPPGKPITYTERYRPQFHYTTPQGWINDPVGLFYYDGEYHLFCDHNIWSTGFPRGIFDGHQSHWSHSISKDLIHWQHMPIAVYPDELGACYSGSGVIDWDNTTGFQTGDDPPVVLCYTSAGSWGQSLVYSNDRGRTWVKYEGNPVLEEIATANRDPMIFWHEPTQKWVMILYVKKGQAHFFNSNDMKEWKATSVVDLIGFLECPDMFQLPVDGDSKKLKWLLYDARFSYWIGEFDGKTFKPETGELRCEFGINFHAAQSWETPEKKRVQIGWMNGGRYPAMPFNQQQTFPCELTLRTTPAGIRLHTYPIEGIKSLHTSSFTLKDHVLKPGENPLSKLSGDLFDITMDIEIGKATEFGLRLHETSITYADGKITSHGAVANVAASEGRIKLRILVDRTSIETFVNDGQAVLPCCFVPKNQDTGLELYAKGGNAKIHSLRVSKLRSIWGNNAMPKE